MLQAREIYEKLLAKYQESFAKRSREQVSEEERLAFGQLIQEFRESLGLSPKVFAQLLDVAAQTVHRWERGNPVPRKNVVRRLERLIEKASYVPQPQQRIASGQPEIVIRVEVGGVLEELLRKLLFSTGR